MRRCRTAAVLAGAVVLLAGCGGAGGRHLARGDAVPLIALADRIPGESAYAQARDIRALEARAVALAISGGGSTGPVPVKPVPHGATPAEQAHNLNDWPNRYSR